MGKQSTVEKLLSHINDDELRRKLTREWERRSPVRTINNTVFRDHPAIRARYQLALHIDVGLEHPYTMDPQILVTSRVMSMQGHNVLASSRVINNNTLDMLSHTSASPFSIDRATIIFNAIRASTREAVDGMLETAVMSEISPGRVIIEI